MAKIGVMVGQMFSIGGVGIIAIEQVRNLNKLGYQAELILLKRTKYPIDKYINDIPVRYISDEMNFFEKFSFMMPFFSFFALLHLTYGLYIQKYIKKGQYSVIICHETYTCFVAMAIKSKVEIPFLAFIYDPVSYILPKVYSKSILKVFFPVLLPLGRKLDTKIINESSGVMVCSGLHEKTIHNFSPEAKIYRIYPGCYPLSKLTGSRRNIIISLTKWDVGKNPKFIVDILSKIKDKKIRWIIAGNWAHEELKRDFIKYAEEKGVLKRLKIVGRISEEEKRELLSKAKILVHPIVEAFGMFALEAAGCGCPFIIPEKSGVTELFINGKHGYFLPEGDLESYVNKLNMLMSDEKKLQKMGSEAYSIAKNYSWEKHAGRVKNALDELFDHP